ncbi:TetR/AcrR family transcriptional regulator C-terminal domain-containing protein [Acetobacterium tundrae]|uniref:TetR family transcriptional regulator n=1 Tax=Acetobacterium tundrae TaxID=132932 RepID=A0ABR6WJ19_9FIRM|nr:TetR/AcrR family transcriptional regulator C-terminal domain-containing protein [Acetobacterium tundrae]MBC3796470.1 TetR family transcriptional regulator [Acetobacterium tundrae]
MSESSITKKAIANGLKNLLKIKPFEKITISDITNQCGLNRQTFYYHFQDKYALVNWIYYQEAIMVITQDLSIENWDIKVLDLLTTMKEDALFYQTTLKDIYSDEFKNYLFSVSKGIFLEFIEHFITNLEMKDEKKTFIAEFISYGIVGMINDWVQQGMKQSPEEITQNIKDIIYDSRMLAVSRYFQELAKSNEETINEKK